MDPLHAINVNPGAKTFYAAMTRGAYRLYCSVPHEWQTAFVAAVRDAPRRSRTRGMPVWVRIVGAV